MNEIKEILNSFLDEIEYKLIDIKKVFEHDFKINVLQVFVAKKNNQKIDSDELGQINKLIFEKIYDLIPDDYTLEVSTKGIYFKPKTLDDLFNLINQEIKFTSPQYKGIGKIVDVDKVNQIVTFEILEKTKKVTTKIKFNNLSKMEYEER